MEAINVTTIRMADAYLRLLSYTHSGYPSTLVNSLASNGFFFKNSIMSQCYSCGTLVYVYFPNNIIQLKLPNLSLSNNTHKCTFIFRLYSMLEFVCKINGLRFTVNYVPLVFNHLWFLPYDVNVLKTIDIYLSKPEGRLESFSADLNMSHEAKLFYGW